MIFILLISRKIIGFSDLNLAIPLVLGTLIFISSLNLVLSRVEHEKSFYLGAGLEIPVKI